MNAEQLTKLYTELYTPITHTPRNERERLILRFQMQIRAKYDMGEINAIAAKQKRTRYEAAKIEAFSILSEQYAMELIHIDKKVGGKHGG
ncbi:hypothetical protein OK414_29475 [Priestia sp. JV24]|uniref:hypothetical protein n=1 Tax=Priestia TaxID=2800373 RepID=UPI0021D65A34|nr:MULTISPECIES: hypothetical protein [Priestia]MCU7713078.1 hypothetical protein [Priestia megaterium]MCW1049186.1 hypothetical protein [Priestia sp. JV24]